MNNNILSIVAPLAYLVMVFVNALANILPINGVSTGAISDSYPNLFAPAGITFSIWGVIYLALGAYSVYQFTQRNVGGVKRKFFEQINLWFIFSSIINSVWIFAWHYRLIGLTVVLMLLLLFCLIKIADIVRLHTLSTQEKLLVKVPFGIYFGWITVATIANVTTFLVSIGWNGWGIADEIWMMVVLVVGVAISAWRMVKDSSIAYGLVPVWAYFGIWLKHTSGWGFNGQYPMVIMTVLVCLAVLIFFNGYLVASKKFV